MIESGRRHGAFDVRYPIQGKTAAPAWELERDWERRGKLEWSVFVASSFPNGGRHDFEAVAAYEAYGNALDRAASVRRPSTSRARHVLAAAGAGVAVRTVSPSPALSAWESEGGSVEHDDCV
jgi:hypothetical protein